MADFLASGKKKDRQHYKQTLQKAQELGIRLTKHAYAPDVEAALAAHFRLHFHSKFRNAEFIPILGTFPQPKGDINVALQNLRGCDRFSRVIL